MNEPRPRQSLLFISDDDRLRKFMQPSIGRYADVHLASTMKEGLEHLLRLPADTVLVDVSGADIEGVQAIHQLPTAPLIGLLVNKISSSQALEARQGGVSIILDRNAVSRNLLDHLLGVLRTRMFRTVLSSDLRPGHVSPSTIFHYLSSKDHYVAYLVAGERITADKIERLRDSHVRHLYVRESGFEPLFPLLRRDASMPSRSERLHECREAQRRLICDFFDLSSLGSVSRGQAMGGELDALTLSIASLVRDYRSPFDCLLELPYPRWSKLAHGLNTAIYACIFATELNLDSPLEFAQAALLHNLGLAGVEQAIVDKPESALTAPELREYSKHPLASIEIIKSRCLPITERVEKIILQHHERFDGKGFPSALRANEIDPAACLLSMLGSFDYYNTVRPGEHAISPVAAWNRVQESAAKFSPGTFSAVEAFFAGQEEAPV